MASSFQKRVLRGPKSAASAAEAEFDNGASACQDFFPKFFRRESAGAAGRARAITLPPMSTLGDLIGNDTVFPVLAERDYFNHAGISPAPRPTADAIRGYADHFQRHSGVGYDFAGTVEGFRSIAAHVIGADADEVAITHHTSEGVSQVALGLAWEPGDRVVTTGAEYPANLYPWMSVAARFGVELVVVPEETDDRGVVRVRHEAILEACDHPRTKLLAVSHVQWGSGQRMDAARLGAFCRERGILFSLDAIQSMGVAEVDVRAMHVDFLQAGAHKWMLGALGAGILFVRRELQDRLTPASVGWHNFVNPMQWEDIDFTLQNTARRFEPGSPPLVSCAATRAGLEMLDGAGMAGVAARVATLCDRFADALPGAGYRVVTPRGGDDLTAGAVCFVPTDGDPKAVFETLSRGHRTELASRCGRVRFSPHFYNTEEQVDRLVERLRTL